MTALLHDLTLDAVTMATTTGTPLPASGTVRIRREGGFVSGGQYITPGHYDAAYAAGAFTDDLAVPVPDDPDRAARYEVTLAGQKFVVSISQSSSNDLADLIALDGVEDVSAVSQLLSLYATAAELTTAIATRLTQAQADALYAAIGHVSTKASAGTLGHVRVGTGLSIDADGILSASGGGGGGTTVTVGAWVNFTLENGWGNLNVVPAGYRKIAIGGVDTYVELRGEIYRAPFVSGVTIATLPDGYRPPTNWRQQFVIFGNTGPGEIIIDPSGPITSYTGGTAMDLSSVRIYLI